MGKGASGTAEEGRVGKAQADLRKQKESERFPLSFLFCGESSVLGNVKPLASTVKVIRN
jgi:hypothetical protein